MLDTLLSFLDGGLTGASLPWMLLYFAIAAQLTILSVTLYLHRCQAHRGVDLHGLVSHPCRLWLWMSTGMNTKEWVAIHRKHHARCETPEDPHSPQFHGIGKVVVHGVALYTEAAKDGNILDQFGHGTPDDWIERKVYSRFKILGPALLLLINFAAFGVAGIAVWALQMLVIPILAAGLVNGLGHWWGYRNFDTDDRSHNLTPWAVLLGGEELHNNHHAFPSSARFALRRGEFDIGWMVLRALSVLRLAKIRRVAPVLERHEVSGQADHETLRAVLVHRFQVMTDYFRNVVVPVVQEEAQRAGASMRRWRRQARKALAFQSRLEGADQRWFSRRPTLHTVWEFRQRLRSLYERRGVGGEHLLKALQEWCHDAEATGIRALQQFADRLKGYRLAG
ncbi:DesA family fatty acid desaturase [Pseudofulvimonas gallinarii]|jgi:stearoyl-CoA desaturase (delta-9 desaturase)|uniref:Stearoyl-CoA desaturase (Delta-9 desaturase) n=2 Tax=Pseudofulvimonas gallinarii TaxID=634155 RepID=A0A4S3KVH6_9GAMM|nr:fatty acid desaturase [Pseudofulvimonas gallinarii]TCS97197.1 stearoyl-CoA desaturase (delta-9 desaturase) [Pseudofulvimonas gallinarii]THD12528.1 acyl-CoA desaturase [Pseudofulvimonas gallinarii]